MPQISALDISAYNNSVALPVQGVEISVFDTSNNQEIYNDETNAEGKISPVLLSTPPIELSLTPNSGKPFSTWNVTAVFPDGNVIQIFGVQTYPETTAILQIISKT